MLRLIAYLIGQGVSTTKVIPELLDEGIYGLPAVSEKSCANGCNACIDACPTDAIKKALAGSSISSRSSGSSVSIDRGACIGCNLCVQSCPTGTIVNDGSTDNWAYDRDGLIMSAAGRPERDLAEGGIFNHSLSIRVVSTGCAACDLELSAANNPIFDMDRFGIHVVASPRFADALLITGPVPKAMHDALLSCYQAMAEPKLVIAMGTCAISGGVHSHGYAEANGVEAVLPADLLIPGCPPHPWQLIKGLLAAKKLKGKKLKGTSQTSEVATERPKELGLVTKG